MKSFTRLSIKYKLIVVVLLTTTIGLTIAATAFLSYDRINQRNALIHEMLILSKVIALRSAVAVSFKDQKNAADNLSALGIRKNVRMACMYDKSGELFVKFELFPLDNQCIPQLARTDYEPTISDHYLEVYQPIYRNNETIGYLLVQVGLEELHERIVHQLQISIATLLGALFFAFFLTSRFQKQIYKPIAHLDEVATEITQNHNYSIRAITNNQDELGKLVHAFNNMLDEIERDKEQMDEIADSLSAAKVNLILKNDELMQALEDANIARTELAQFTSMVSHELRTPIAVLSCEIELLVDGVREANEENLTSLLEEVEHFNGLINDMFEIVLSDARNLTYKKEPADIVRLIGRSAELFLWKFNNSKLKLSVIKEPSLSVNVNADPKRIRQVMDNLLKNSLKYTNPEGETQIIVTHEEGWVWVSVQDTPPGVSELALTKLFDRFFRVEKSRNRATGGAGLGLAICKTIIEDHGGKIVATASPLGGVCISFCLPAYIDAENEDELTPSLSVNDSGEGE